VREKKGVLESINAVVTSSSPKYSTHSVEVLERGAAVSGEKRLVASNGSLTTPTLVILLFAGGILFSCIQPLFAD
jgi:hypothetical protein